MHQRSEHDQEIFVVTSVEENFLIYQNEVNFPHVSAVSRRKQTHAMYLYYFQISVFHFRPFWRNINKKCHLQKKQEYLLHYY